MIRAPQEGIYILGNDRVLDNVIALVNSIRLHDDATPVCLIPYDDDHAGCARYVTEHNGTVFEDAELLTFLSGWSRAIHEKRIAEQGLEEKLNRMRKFASWFGPFERFAYIDADCVVFRKISPFFRHLDTYDFLTHAGTKTDKSIRYIFNASGRGLFPQDRIRHAFSSGFWLSRRGLFTRELLESALPEIKAASVAMDFDQVVDQPVINYLVLRHAQNIASVAELEGLPLTTWAGTGNIQIDGRIARVNGRLLTFLHWAGSAKHPTGAGRELWQSYRDMKPAKRA